MPRKTEPWFRWYVEAFRDRKVRRLTPAERWLFVSMCGAGKESPEIGRLLVAPGLPMTDAEVAEYADVPMSVVRSGLPKMDALEMVKRDPDGTLRVVNLEVRQFRSDTSAERTRNYRERHNDDVVTSQPSHTKRHSDGGSDVPDTETETEQKKSGGARKRGTRITEDWMPSPEVKSKMLAERPRVDYRTEHRNFIDHFLAASGQNATKVDWDAAWRKWMRSARSGVVNGQAARPATVHVTPPAEPVEPLEWAR